MGEIVPQTKFSGAATVSKIITIPFSSLHFCHFTDKLLLSPCPGSPSCSKSPSASWKIWSRGLFHGEDDVSLFPSLSAAFCFAFPHKSYIWSASLAAITSVTEVAASRTFIVGKLIEIPGSKNNTKGVYWSKKGQNGTNLARPGCKGEVGWMSSPLESPWLSGLFYLCEFYCNTTTPHTHPSVCTTQQCRWCRVTVVVTMLCCSVKFSQLEKSAKKKQKRNKQVSAEYFSCFGSFVYTLPSTVMTTVKWGICTRRTPYYLIIWDSS